MNRKNIIIIVLAIMLAILIGVCVFIISSQEFTNVFNNFNQYGGWIQQ